MAFSLRKMLSTIYSSKKSDSPIIASPETTTKKRPRPEASLSGDSSEGIPINKVIEPDSTSVPSSLSFPVSVRNFASKKGSFSDTDVLKTNLGSPEVKKDRRKSKKLKLDIKKANNSLSDSNSENDNQNLENTPKHISLGCQSSDIFSERLKEFDLNKPFDLFDAMSEGRPSSPSEHSDVEETLSDTDISLISSKKDTSPIKMCRKVGPMYESNTSIDYETVDKPSHTGSAESFANMELDKNEEDRINLLISYQMKLEKMEQFLKQLLQEFQFHIEVSKVFHCKSVVSSLPGDEPNLPTIGEIACIDNESSDESPPNSWNIVLEKEDILTKFKLRKQLLSMKHFIEEFINIYLKNQVKPEDDKYSMDKHGHTRRSITFDLHRTSHVPQKRLHVNKKKKNKRHNDFPDLKEALDNLFSLEAEHPINLSLTSTEKCTCNCRNHISSPSEVDSGLTKEEDTSSQSITSSIGNFSLDSSTLTAYSESLDQILSYNSFQDQSLFNAVLQKPAIERITFYVQVHSIQLNMEEKDLEFGKSAIIFYCPGCKHTENDEHGVLDHIFSQSHCEKIHFLYKTAYIKKCFAAGKEIQPSTVLNSMTMYRDENKIVCFGDAMYACSLCFENLIIGESVLMAHCSEPEHVSRREMLSEIIE